MIVFVECHNLNSQQGVKGHMISPASCTRIKACGEKKEFYRVVLKELFVAHCYYAYIKMTTTFHTSLNKKYFVFFLLPASLVLLRERHT